MPSTKKPPRHREEVVATILYFGILGINDQVVAELVNLKVGIEISPKECKERLMFSSSKFTEWGIPWTPVGIGNYIAGFTTRDTFHTITAIDAQCENVLGKASHNSGKSFVASTDRRF